MNVCSHVCSKDAKEFLAGSYNVTFDPCVLSCVLLVDKRKWFQKCDDSLRMSWLEQELFTQPLACCKVPIIWIPDLEAFPSVRVLFLWWSLFDDFSALFVINHLLACGRWSRKSSLYFFFQVRNKGAKKENVRKENTYFY